MENNKLKEELEYMIAISKMKEKNNIAIKRNLISKKIGIAACACIMLISGFAYAKDIENYFKSLFNNSTKAIDTAIENGYVQKEEMDFVYDKDIGVKVDNLVVDDLNLAISFNFESKKEDIKSIRFNDFTITNDNDKVIYRSVFKFEENPEDIPLYNSMSWSNMPEKTSDTTFLDSILIGLRAEHEEFKELLFDIKSITLTYQDDRREIIDGNWKFNIVISEKMKNNTKIKYTFLEENEYVKNATATLSPTGMIIKLNLKEILQPKKDVLIKVDRGEEVLAEEVIGILLKYNNESYLPESVEGGVFRNDDGIIDVTVKFNNIGAFSEIVDKFEIRIVPFDSTITLVKEEN